MPMPVYRAACHCGRLTIRFRPLDSPSQTGCDCSICRRKASGGVTVAVGDLVVEEDETLRRYTFGTHVAQHYFCDTCGIHTHHQRRSNPNEYRVVAGCILGPIEGASLPSDRPSRPSVSRDSKMHLLETPVLKTHLLETCG